MKKYITLIVLSFLAVAKINAQQATIEKLVKNQIDDLEKIYIGFHQNPEVSMMESESAKKMATELRKANCEVYDNFGGGVVGVMKNGNGTTILLRADMDALPIKEETELPYASTKRMKDVNGKEVDAMHACGHDVHMTVLIGIARTMSSMKDKWRGTIIFVAQPAEEIVVGAKAMMDNGLYEKFGKPSSCLAFHVSSSLEAGKVGYCPEYALANVNSVNITLLGEGGHGAYPHLTKDPIVMAARLILDLQTIVSREIPAIEPAVVTVGTIHAGTKRNIVPNEVKLELTVRTYTEQTKQTVIEKIKHKAKAAAIAAGMPEDKMPIVEITPEYATAVYNDPDLTQKIVQLMQENIGKDNVVKVPPVMVSEDFGRFGDDVTPKIPVALFWLGSVDPKRIEQYKKEGKTLPSLHSSTYFPLPRPTIVTGINTMTHTLLGLMK
jgi:amidohydrolase